MVANICGSSEKMLLHLSPSQQIEFWKIGGPKLSADILSCQGNYIYCVTMNAGAFCSEYKFSLSTQKFSSWSSFSKNLCLHKMSNGDECQQNNETLETYRMTTVSTSHAYKHLDSAVLKCSPKNMISTQGENKNNMKSAGLNVFIHI